MKILTPSQMEMKEHPQERESLPLVPPNGNEGGADGRTLHEAQAHGALKAIHSQEEMEGNARAPSHGERW